MVDVTLFLASGLAVNIIDYFSARDYSRFEKLIYYAAATEYLAYIGTVVSN